MGQSKQLLKINNEELLLKAVNVAVQSLMKTIVVLGANEKDHHEVIAHHPVDIILNSEWQKGMGSSLKTGLSHALKLDADLEAIIIMVCDQPLLTSYHLKKIVKTFQETNKPIVASHYSGSPGVPALFHRSLFSEIAELPDDHGAKKIIERHSGNTTLIEFPEGAVDLDTPEDVSKFNQ